MKRPEKKDYDFNEPFEDLRFGLDMMRYADQLENEVKELRGYLKEIKEHTDDLLHANEDCHLNDSAIRMILNKALWKPRAESK